MGSACCKTSPTVDPDGVNNADETNEDPSTKEITKKEEEANQVQYLRDTLHNNLEAFILNQALLGVQFFQNYDLEIEKIRAEMKNAEDTPIEGCENLVQIQVDKLHEFIGNRITFRPSHGPQKNKEVALHPLRKFIAYKNVQVKRNLQTPVEKLKEPYYRVIAQDVNTRNLFKSGYVNLNEEESKDLKLEVPYERLKPRISIAKSTASSVNSTDDSDEDDYQPQAQSLTPPAEPFYGYTTIQSLSSSQPLIEVRMGVIPHNSSSIPRTCFKTREIPNIQPQRRRAIGGKLYYTVTLLESVAFKHHFLDVLAENLASPLHLSQSLNHAEVQGPRVVCNAGKFRIHLTPVFYVNWWPECADEFLKPSNEHLKWPTKKMQDKIKQFGCLLQPLGHLRRRGENKDFATQWSIINPKGEQHLLLYTTHTQLRCYLFLLAIFKNFLETEGTCIALDESHLLHLLFWEIHENFSGWSLTFEWDRLKSILEKLYNAIKNRKIKDFIFQDRNLLNSTPSIFLNKVQSALKRLLDNPVPHVLLALKNLRIRSRSYPDFNYSDLYQLATVSEVLFYLNPNLNKKEKKKKSESEVDELDDNRAWRQQALLLKKEEEKKKKLTNRVSVETIDLLTKTASTTKAESTAIRHREILETFINHFLQMTEQSIAFSAFKQARLYLKQTDYLTAILEIDKLDDFNNICEYKERIDNLRRKSERKEKASNPEQLKNQLEERISLHDRQLPEIPALP